MSLTSDEKKKIIDKYAQAKGDTGSPVVQIALATEKVTRLVDHLKKNKKDVHSRRGLLSIVSKRRRLLSYLLKKDEGRYRRIIQDLELTG